MLVQVRCIFIGKAIILILIAQLKRVLIDVRILSSSVSDLFAAQQFKGKGRTEGSLGRWESEISDEGTASFFR